MKTSDHVLKADFVAAYQRRIIEGQREREFICRKIEKTYKNMQNLQGMLSRVDVGNHVLDGGADAPTGRGTFRVYDPDCKARDLGVG